MLRIVRIKIKHLNVSSWTGWLFDVGITEAEKLQYSAFWINLFLEQEIKYSTSE